MIKLNRCIKLSHSLNFLLIVNFVQHKNKSVFEGLGIAEEMRKIRGKIKFSIRSIFTFVF